MQITKDEYQRTIEGCALLQEVNHSILSQRVLVEALYIEKGHDKFFLVNVTRLKRDHFQIEEGVDRSDVEELEFHICTFTQLGTTLAELTLRYLTHP